MIISIDYNNDDNDADEYFQTVLMITVLHWWKAWWWQWWWRRRHDDEDDDDVDVDVDVDDDDDDDCMVSRVQSDSWQLFGKHKYFPKFALGHFYAEVDDDDNGDVDHDERKADRSNLWTSLNLFPFDSDHSLIHNYIFVPC